MVRTPEDYIAAIAAAIVFGILFVAVSLAGFPMVGVPFLVLGLLFYWSAYRAWAKKQAEEERLRRILHDIQKLAMLSPADFERAIMMMLGGQVTKATGDMGIDGWVGGIPVQIKQSTKVSRPVVDAFETAMRRAGCTTGYIVAFGFTKGAYEEARRAASEGLTIKLITVDQLLPPASSG
jgi:membrane protein implicated in regulation of membrane protease activity